MSLEFDLKPAMIYAWFSERDWHYVERFTCLPILLFAKLREGIDVDIGEEAPCRTD